MLGGQRRLGGLPLWRRSGLVCCAGQCICGTSCPHMMPATLQRLWQQDSDNVLSVGRCRLCMHHSQTRLIKTRTIQILDADLGRRP